MTSFTQYVRIDTKPFPVDTALNLTTVERTLADVPRNLVMPTWLYDAIVKDYVGKRLIGLAVPCPGCEWNECVDCHPEVQDARDRAEEELEQAVKRHNFEQAHRARLTFHWGDGNTTTLEAKPDVHTL